MANIRVESLMPKGVEHHRWRYLHTNLRGVESLMPKGVEHYQPLQQVRYQGASVESLMPKGVEHI